MIAPLPSYLQDPIQIQLAAPLPGGIAVSADDLLGQISTAPDFSDVQEEFRAENEAPGGDGPDDVTTGLSLSDFMASDDEPRERGKEPCESLSLDAELPVSATSLISQIAGLAAPREARAPLMFTPTKLDGSPVDLSEFDEFREASLDLKVRVVSEQIDARSIAVSEPRVGMVAVSDHRSSFGRIISVRNVEYTSDGEVYVHPTILRSSVLSRQAHEKRIKWRGRKASRGSSGAATSSSSRSMETG